MPLVCGLLLALSSCAALKPLRVLTPQAAGMTCPNDVICIDDLAYLDQATALRTEAVRFVESRFGAFRDPPRVLFCKTTACAEKMGRPQLGGFNLGLTGSVINPHGWRSYIVSHELIHHMQNERFGVGAVARQIPFWFSEGMAYTLSEDPRRPLPRAETEAYRAKYEAWIRAGNRWQNPPSE